MNQYRISFRTVTIRPENKSLYFAETVDKDVNSDSPFNAIRQIFPDATYYYKINPYCHVFYDNQFGNIFVKS